VKEKKLQGWNGCPIRYGMGIFGDKWSLLIIRDLMFKGKRYYSEFYDSEEEISTNILADRLAKLEANGVISKSKDPENRSKYIYRLTEKGLDLMPMMLEMVDWAAKYDKKTEAPKEFVEALRKDRKKFGASLRKQLKKS